MLENGFPCSSAGHWLPSEVAYTGQMQFINDNGGNWRIKFLTSGVFTLKSPRTLDIDVFLVGGGAGGGYSGSGGGYTTNGTTTIYQRIPYEILVPSGGAAGTDGGMCVAFGFSAAGGKSGTETSGGNGGSGGGGNGDAISGGGGADGSDGLDGQNKTGVGKPGGKGQGTTTREFGESDGELYSGGGGAYALYNIGSGGNGGGGDGGLNASYYGGGGGGNNNLGEPNFIPCGYQGIAIIRNHKR